MGPLNNACDNVTISDTLLTIIPKDFNKDRCVIGYGYEVGKLLFKHIRPRNEKQKKGSLILVTTQIWFNLKCLAQCICSKSNSLTFLDNVWFGMFERSLRPVLRLADSP